MIVEVYLNKKKVCFSLSYFSLAGYMVTKSGLRAEINA